MADKSYKLILSLSDGSTINAGTITAPQGPNGANGVTFIPSVSEAGILSWTNDGGLANPDPVNIKSEAGANGVTFIPSVSEAGVLSWTNDGGLANPDPVNIKGEAAVITESDVAGWGFTKNAGTITEIKMNGSSKGTSGVVDLGTVLTDASEFATSAQGTKADNAMPKSGGTFTGDVIISSGKTLKTDVIKSADGTKWIAEIRGGALELGGASAPLYFYSSTRPVHANENKELAYTSDIPTNYVTTDTDWEGIVSTKKFFRNQLLVSDEIDVDASAPAPEANQYRYIDFLDKNDKRIGIVGVSIDTNKCYGAYLQAGNVASMGVLSTPDGFGYSYGPIPPNKDNTNKLATTSWAGRRYKSIADFGFTSQTTVKAIVQKIIDNWYEYCTFACTNDEFNNFSDTPEGWGTLIIEVGSNALRPLISFTKQIGDSNKYKHWQANVVRNGNQVTEIQWYELALKTDIPKLQWVTPKSTNEIKSAILWKVTNEKSADTHGGIEIAIGSGEIGNGSAYYKYNSINQYGLCNVNIISDSQTFVELIPYARSVPNQQYRTNIVLSNWKILKLV